MHYIRPFPLINNDKKFVLFTNAKCGGTVLKSWFLKTMHIEENFSGFFTALSNFKFAFVLKWFLHYKKFVNGTQVVDSDRYLRKFIKDYREATRDLLPQIIDSDDWFRFAVVRNPYDRLVSAFVDKFCGKDLDKRWVQKIVHEVNATDTQGQPAISFAQFADYLAKSDNDKVNVHWRRQSCLLENIKLDKIIALKDIAVELPKLEKKFAVDSGMDFSRRRQSNMYNIANEQDVFMGDVPNTQLITHFNEKGTFPPMPCFYDDVLRDKVKKIYAGDFDLYPFE